MWTASKVSSHTFNPRLPSSKLVGYSFRCIPRAVDAIATSGGSPFSAEQAPKDVPLMSEFDWKDHWYPTAFERDISEGELYSFTLLETPLVIWRDSEGKFRAFRDACPHRLVPLSEGRIASTGCLECPYHGWQFDSSGACTMIPQGGDEKNPRSAAMAYQCASAQGLVWVKLQPFVSDEAMDTTTIPILPELEDPEWFELPSMWRDLPMDYSTLIENVVDVGHVPFTHHASVSKRQSSGNYSDMRSVSLDMMQFLIKSGAGDRIVTGVEGYIISEF